ncbi:MAG: DUF6357 family protein [Candidatus Microsaccharimonas sp.]
MDNVYDEVVFRRESGWIPQVVRKDDALYLMLGAGADANHEPRTFMFPISKAHLEVIKEDFVRHLLLWSAILPLCDAAGTRDLLDEDAAVALLDPILFGAEAEVEALFKEIPWQKGQLIARHADIALLERGELFAAMKTVTSESDWNLTAEYNANRQRERRGVHLSPLDAAILKYTNQYLHGGGLPSRKPDAVEPELLPQVLEVIATAEKACAGMELPSWAHKDYSRRQKAEWNVIEDRVKDAVRDAYPTLVDDAVRTVSFLMCSEAASRARKATT